MLLPATISIVAPSTAIAFQIWMPSRWRGIDSYTTSLLDFYGRSRRVRANDLWETVKLVILLGQYMQDNYQGRYYAKAQNLARVLRAAYDEALNGADPCSCRCCP